MKFAIRTKYLPVTNHRGSRLSASTMAKHPVTGRRDRVVFGYYEFNGDMFAKHCAVAKALAERLGIVGVWVAADDGASGYVFVCVGHTLIPDFAFRSMAVGEIGTLRTSPTKGDDFYI